jgi:hypothetical protein
MKALLIFAAGIIVCLISSSLQASDELVAWELGIKANTTPNLSLSAAGQLRLDQSLIRLRSLTPEAAISYRLSKHHSLSIGYRLSYRRSKGNDFEWAHRGHLDLNSWVKIGEIRLRHRLRFQEEFDWTKKGQLKDEPILTNRVKTDYRRWDYIRPYLSAEHFLALDTWSHGWTRKWQLATGVEIISQSLEWDVFYQLELPVNSSKQQPLTHVLGLAVYYETYL